MGTILVGYGDASYDHEGNAAQVLADGSLTTTFSAETESRMVGQVVAVCDCGWTGATYYPTTAGLCDERAEGFALREWEHTHARPVLEARRAVRLDPGNAADVADLGRALTRAALARGVPGSCWYELAEVVLRELVALRDGGAGDTGGPW